MSQEKPLRKDDTESSPRYTRETYPYTMLRNPETYRQTTVGEVLERGGQENELISIENPFPYDETEDPHVGRITEIYDFGPGNVFVGAGGMRAAKVRYDTKLYIRNVDPNANIELIKIYRLERVG